MPQQCSNSFLFLSILLSHAEPNILSMAARKELIFRGRQAEPMLKVWCMLFMQGLVDLEVFLDPLTHEVDIGSLELFHVAYFLGEQSDIFFDVVGHEFGFLVIHLESH